MPPFAFRDPVVNLYVNDVAAAARFYSEHFGLTESFRTPPAGPPAHIELRLGPFTLGLASVAAARAMHGLPLEPGNPRGEIAFWTDDVDAVHAYLLGCGIRCISAPHTFIGAVRAAWYLDPEGNHVQVVSTTTQGAPAPVTSEA